MTLLKNTAKSAFAIAALVGLSACATVESQNAMDARLDTLESKVNEALRKSSTAKVDAATALFIAQDK